MEFIAVVSIRELLQKRRKVSSVFVLVMD